MWWHIPAIPALGVEAAGPEAQSHSQLHGEFKPSLGHMTPCLKTKRKQNKTKQNPRKTKPNNTDSKDGHLQTLGLKPAFDGDI